VVSVAATRAQRLVAAVINTRAILIENASAYVSSISTPLIFIKIPHLILVILWLLVYSQLAYSQLRK
jgi:hypothetical protein